MHVSLTTNSILFGYTAPRDSIDESCCSSTSSFVRHHLTSCHKNCSNLHSHPWCARVHFLCIFTLFCLKIFYSPLLGDSYVVGNSSVTLTLFTLQGFCQVGCDRVYACVCLYVYVSMCVSVNECVCVYMCVNTGG